MQVYRLKIKRNQCSGCGICSISCPTNFNQLRSKGYLSKENACLLVKNGVAYDIYDEKRKVNCDGCGICLDCCPQSVIQLEIIEIE